MFFFFSELNDFRSRFDRFKSEWVVSAQLNRSQRLGIFKDRWESWKKVIVENMNSNCNNMTPQKKYQTERNNSEKKIFLSKIIRKTVDTTPWKDLNKMAASFDDAMAANFTHWWFKCHPPHLHTFQFPETSKAIGFDRLSNNRR